MALSNRNLKVNNIWSGLPRFYFCRLCITLRPLLEYCDRDYRQLKETNKHFLEMPRLVRRQPLSERIMAAMNPMDFLLWLSEELETRDWDSATAGTQMGLAMNFLFLLARANLSSSTKSDDVFSDETSSGWLTFFVSFMLLGGLLMNSRLIS